MSSALCREAEAGNLAAVVKLLASYPTAVNAKGGNKVTVNAPCVDPHETNACIRISQDRSPLHLAAAAGHAGVVSELLLRDALYDAEDKDGSVPLHLAAEHVSFNKRSYFHCVCGLNPLTQLHRGMRTSCSSC